METDWTHFAGNLLRHSRAQAGLSQHQLAVLAGVSNAEVARIETFRVQPSIPVLGRLLNAIGLGVELSSNYIDNRVDARFASEAIRERLSENDDEGAYRNWLVLLDDLEAVTPVRLLELVEKPAIRTGESRYDALIAALTEYVCERKSVEPPAWVNEPWRATDEWHVSGIATLHEIEHDESPPPFARRGVYITLADLSHA